MFEHTGDMSKYDQIVEWLKNHWITALALVLFLVIISLPKVRDGLSLICSWIMRVLRRNVLDPNAPIELNVCDEKVTFTELLRSMHHDVVKVHAVTHMLGVAAEHVWINHRYPKSEFLKQSLTTLDLITGKKKYQTDQVHFDIIRIRLENGREKEVYFDISSFFEGGASSHLNPDEFIARKIADIYKR